MPEILSLTREEHEVVGERSITKKFRLQQEQENKLPEHEDSGEGHKEGQQGLRNRGENTWVQLNIGGIREFENNQKRQLQSVREAYPAGVR